MAASLPLVESAKSAIPIWPVFKADMKKWIRSRPAAQAAWLEAQAFEAEPGRHLLLPDAKGRIDGVLLAVAQTLDLWSFAGLPGSLPAGAYRIDAALSRRAATDAAAGWALGTYRFDRYLGRAKGATATLVWPKDADRDAARRLVEATCLVRDLVNTPAADLGPAELAEQVKTIARAHGAKTTIIAGSDLLKKNYPMVHAVGRAASRAPRLVDMVWGSPRAPKVTLVGKGVCFDSGGLDIKTASGMALMKKDMGGAATALGLARMIMDARLPVRLRVLIPAVENAIAGDAFRPGDILNSRAGISVEIGNTDAEGRLILADALTEADREKPELLFDFATLTGAARVALGPELPALYCDDERFVAELQQAATTEGDPFWRLPLWRPYRSLLESKIADINNTGNDGMAGSITAALFLAEFVREAKTWVHVDLFAWNNRARPGRPVGGEAMIMRTVFAALAARYARGRTKS